MQPPYEVLPHPHAWLPRMEFDDEAEWEQARYFLATQPDPNEH
ncbi:MAG TPA: hypothetical protein VGD42_20620 [Lysobacter sp.]